MADDDLVMESTTDSPEQIAEGLGVEIEQPVIETADGEAEGVPIEEPETEGQEPAPIEDEPTPGEVTPEPAKVKTPKPKPQTKKKLEAPRNVNGAVAAVRREEEAKRKVAETERDAALARIAELTTGTRPVERVEPRVAAATKPVTAEEIPDTHPRIASLLTKIAALGAKPKQESFEDFAEFEAKRDQWIEDRATLRSRVESVREDVARQATLANDEARRAADATTTAFQATEAEARARHDDYDERIAEAKAANLRVSDDVVTAILESPHGGELRYYLCANPAETARINALSPHRQVVELGIIESRIVAGIPPAGPQKPARPVARTTKAPDPQQNLMGEFSSGGNKFKSREEEMNHPGTSLARYNQLRNEMDAESGRRMTH